MYTLTILLPTYSIFIKEVEDHACKPVIWPVAMDQQDLAKELKPGHGKVRSHDSLHALLASNADTNIRCLNHRHIVGSISCQPSTNNTIDLLINSRLCIKVNPRFLEDIIEQFLIWEMVLGISTYLPYYLYRWHWLVSQVKCVKHYQNSKTKHYVQNFNF